MAPHSTAGASGLWAYAARHAALLAFGCCIALAAWPPAARLSWSGGGRFFAIAFGPGRVVAEIGDGAAGLLDRVPGALRHLPGGVVLEHLSGRASRLRLSVPTTVNLAATGLLWITLILVSTRRRPAPDGRATGKAEEGVTPSPDGGTGAAHIGAGVYDSRQWLWAVRYAAGTAVLAGAFISVYTLPRVTGGAIFTEAQALHACAAALGVCVATMLITFD